MMPNFYRTANGDYIKLSAITTAIQTEGGFVVSLVDGFDYTFHDDDPGEVADAKLLRAVLDEYSAYATVDGGASC